MEIHFQKAFELYYKKTLELYYKYGSLIGATVFCLYITTIIVVSWFAPEANWDMVAYVASILENGDLSPTELHARSWELVQNHVSKGEFLTLTADRPYRIRQYSDPQAFFSMLGFYRVKVLYIKTAALIAGFSDPVDGLRILSTLSVAGIGIVTLYWLKIQKSLFLAPLVIAFFVLGEFGNTAIHVTPDLYAALFVLLAMIFYLRKFETGCAIALFLAFLVRPDNLAFIGVLAVVSIVFGTMRRATIAALIASFASYGFITSSAGHPGWWVQMWFTHIEYVPTLEGFKPDFSVMIYLRIVVQAIARSLINNNWLALLIFGVFFWGYMAAKKVVFKRHETILLATVLLTILSKFVIFPLYETRFHFAYLAVGGLILFTAFGRSISAGVSAVPENKR